MQDFVTLLTTSIQPLEFHWVILACKVFFHLFYLCKYFFNAKILTWEAKGCKSNFYHIWDNVWFFLDQYLTYCSSVLGPSTLGQYLDLQLSAPERAWNSKKNHVVTEMWYNWTYIILHLMSEMWRTFCWVTNLMHNFFYDMFIWILYMFRATMCSSSGGQLY
jgi:hypothetical protein